MSNPVYNFYNCCCKDGKTSTIFPIKTVNGGLWTDWTTGDVIFSNPFYYPINPSGRTEIYNNMEAFHFPYRIKELSLFKSGVNGTTNETMELSIIVMNMAGVTLRTLSTSTIEIVSASIETWIPIPLVSSIADLSIAPNEIIVEKFKISSTNNDDWNCRIFVSGLAEMI